VSELRRMAYLDALGIDGYVSRKQLPGAAVSRRLVLVSPPQSSAQVSQPRQPPVPEDIEDASGPALLRREVAGPVSTGKPPRAEEAKTTTKPVQRPAANGRIPQLQFSVVVAGQWLWIESLGDMPLMREQVWLIEGMANALRVAGAIPRDSDGGLNPIKAQTMRFEWPMHNNPQLDSSEEAVKASLAGFLERQKFRFALQGLVLMGEQCRQWVPESELPLVVIPDGRALLENPALKRQAWEGLAPLLAR